MCGRSCRQPHKQRIGKTFGLGEPGLCKVRVRLPVVRGRAAPEGNIELLDAAVVQSGIRWRRAQGIELCDPVWRPHRIRISWCPGHNPRFLALGNLISGNAVLRPVVARLRSDTHSVYKPDD